ncbi:MAG: GNAT family N-acetyltransferase [Verrucomicrobiota bacterium]
MNTPTQLSLTFRCIEEVDVKPSLDLAIKNFLCVCSPEGISAFSKTRYWHGSKPTYSFLGEIDGKILAHVGVVTRQIRVGAEQIDIAGIQNLAVHPESRGRGFAQQIMTAAMDEAARREIPFGLLFCVAKLERFYNSLGWRTRVGKPTMLDSHGNRVPIPEKNSCMFKNLRAATFPSGEIFLQGADW